LFCLAGQNSQCEEEQLIIQRFNPVKLIEQTLSEKVYRIGNIGIDVYIVGHNQMTDNGIVLSTETVET
jgi:hypothetical protein